MNQMSQTPSAYICSWCSTTNSLFEDQCHQCSTSLSSALVLYDEMDSTNTMDESGASGQTTCADDELMIHSRSFMSQTHKERLFVAAGYVRIICRDVSGNVPVDDI